MAPPRPKKFDDLERASAALSRSKLMVGIPAETDSRGDSAISNAALGYVFETGEPAINMPPRPWLRPSIKSLGGEIAEHLKATAKEVFKKTVSQPGYNPKPDIERSLHALGLRAQAVIRGRITGGINPPLSERTIYARLHRRKNRRSPGPMTPLIDEGNFIKSIGYTVKV